MSLRAAGGGGAARRGRGVSEAGGDACWIGVCQTVIKAGKKRVCESLFMHVLTGTLMNMLGGSVCVGGWGSVCLFVCVCVCVFGVSGCVQM